MPKLTEPCPHGWVLPGDGWVLQQVFNGGQKRLMRCRLCKESRIEVYGKDKRWHYINQMALEWQEKPTPQWAEELGTPDILKPDWDWEK